MPMGFNEWMFQIAYEGGFASIAGYDPQRA